MGEHTAFDTVYSTTRSLREIKPYVGLRHHHTWYAPSSPVDDRGHGEDKKDMH